MKLDLACGDNKMFKDFIGVDKVKTSSVDIVHDLNVYPWPFEDGSVDEVYCSHYVEHIPHDVKNGDERDGLIQFMDELHRVLKLGGQATIIAPYYKSQRAFGDPTHQRFIGDLTFPYYNKEWREVNKLSHYDINCDFDITYSYHVINEMTLKSEEVRHESFLHDWDVINDIVAKMIKR